MTPNEYQHRNVVDGSSGQNLSTISHGNSAQVPPPLSSAPPSTVNQLESLAPPTFQRPASIVGPPTTTTTGRRGGGGEQDRFLDEAEGIELTREDRQEGYDPDLLLQLQPRNTTTLTGPDPNRPLPRPAQQLGSSSGPTVPASSLPYASRAQGSTSINGEGGGRPHTVKGSLARDARQGEGGGATTMTTTEKGSTKYPARPSKNRHSRSNGHARERDSREGGGGGGGGGGGKVKSGNKGGRGTNRHKSSSSSSSRRRPGTSTQARPRKRAPLKWYAKPRTLVIALVAIVVVGAAVGLGVGLTTGREDRDESGQSTPTNGDGVTDGPTIGVQPSASSVGTGTAQGVLPSETDQVTPRASASSSIVPVVGVEKRRALRQVEVKTRREWTRWV